SPILALSSSAGLPGHRSTTRGFSAARPVLTITRRQAMSESRIMALSTSARLALLLSQHQKRGPEEAEAGDGPPRGRETALAQHLHVCPSLPDIQDGGSPPGPQSPNDLAQRPRPPFRGRNVVQGPAGDDDIEARIGKRQATSIGIEDRDALADAFDVRIGPGG